MHVHRFNGMNAKIINYESSNYKLIRLDNQSYFKIFIS